MQINNTSKGSMEEQMDEELKKNLSKIANTVRQLSIEAVQKANSGHPGLPLGCAELGAYLYGHFLRHDPKNPKWMNRDRFVLSAGHGSMWLYSLLFLSGFPIITLEDIKQFRQLHSKTPGHPEYDVPEGVEVTTGPLGQGVGNAVGFGLGMKILETKFNTNEHVIFNNKVVVLAGDGCIMEGVSSEASSLAGHLGIDNLILVYDSNKICLDGDLSECCSEDTKMRYESYGWDVFEIDAYDFDQMDEVFSSLREKQTKPALIIAHTIIGKGSPNKAGSHNVHGSPLGPEELELTKKALDLPEEEFFVPRAVEDFFEQKLVKQKELEASWNDLFKEWREKNPSLAKEYDLMENQVVPENLEEELAKVEIKEPIGGRKASQACLQRIAELMPQVYGGSADLSGSDCTMIKEFPIIKPHDFAGRNIKYGVREFGMGTICNGLAVLGLIRPYCGTFFTFSDYLRNSIRLAALSHYHSIYQFTHDSVFLGEDGPTHQPIEQLASLRAMPNLCVFRPADANEVRKAWVCIMHQDGPCAIILSRQSLPEISGTNIAAKEGVCKGGYIVKKEKTNADYTLFATGSELSLAMDVAAHLEKVGKDVRVVSMVCFELFERQDDAYKQSVVGGDIGKRVSIEAASDFGWHRYIGSDGTAICIEGFGLSAPASEIAQELGFTVDSILARIL
jgi:transketolase